MQHFTCRCLLLCATLLAQLSPPASAGAMGANLGEIEAPALAWANALATDMQASQDSLTQAQALVYGAISAKSDSERLKFDEALGKRVQSSDSDSATLALIYSQRCLKLRPRFNISVPFCEALPAWERLRQADTSNRYIVLLALHLLDAEFEKLMRTPELQSEAAMKAAFAKHNLKRTFWSTQLRDERLAFDDYSSRYKASILNAMRRRPPSNALIAAMPENLGNKLDVSELAVELTINLAAYVVGDELSLLRRCTYPVRPDVAQEAAICVRLAESILANGENSFTNAGFAFAILRAQGEKRPQLAQVDALIKGGELNLEKAIAAIAANHASLRPLLARMVKQGDVATLPDVLAWWQLRAQEIREYESTPK